MHFMHFEVLKREYEAWNKCKCSPIFRKGALKMEFGDYRNRWKKILMVIAFSIGDDDDEAAFYELSADDKYST